MIEVVVGRIGRAHGIRGEVALELRTDEPERRFAVGSQVRLENTQTTLKLVSTRWQNGRLIVQFEGLSDRTAVESVRGRVLVCDVDEAEVPEDDEEYYDRSLVGLQVRDFAGDVVGVITNVVHLPEQDLLAVEAESGERLIPFVRQIVPTVELADGFVQLADVPGLLEDE